MILIEVALNLQVALGRTLENLQSPKTWTQGVFLLISLSISLSSILFSA